MIRILIVSIYVVSLNFVLYRTSPIPAPVTLKDFPSTEEHYVHRSFR